MGRPGGQAFGRVFLLLFARRQKEGVASWSQEVQLYCNAQKKALVL
jgi:hypothetical protein